MRALILEGGFFQFLHEAIGPARVAAFEGSPKPAEGQRSLRDFSQEIV